MDTSYDLRLDILDGKHDDKLPEIIAWCNSRRKQVQAAEARRKHLLDMVKGMSAADRAEIAKLVTGTQEAE